MLAGVKRVGNCRGRQRCKKLTKNSMEVTKLGCQVKVIWTGKI